MRILINGKQEIVTEANLNKLIDELGLPTKSLVVEHNRVIIPQGQWSKTMIEDGDVLELLNFVGGG